MDSRQDRDSFYWAEWLELNNNTQRDQLTVKHSWKVDSDYCFEKAIENARFMADQQKTLIVWVVERNSNYDLLSVPYIKVCI